MLSFYNIKSWAGLIINLFTTIDSDNWYLRISTWFLFKIDFLLIF